MHQLKHQSHNQSIAKWANSSIILTLNLKLHHQSNLQNTQKQAHSYHRLHLEKLRKKTNFYQKSNHDIINLSMYLFQ